MSYCRTSHKNETVSLIREFDHAAEPTAEEIMLANGPVRLVVITQVYENYGGYRWKAKGGQEFHLLSVINPNNLPDFQSLVDDFEDLLICDEEYKEWIVGWNLISYREETYDEKMNREFYEDGYGVHPDNYVGSIRVSRGERIA